MSLFRAQPRAEDGAEEEKEADRGTGHFVAFRVTVNPSSVRPL